MVVSKQSEPETRLWTIGHSTRSIEEFLALLRTHRIAVLIDVRTFPGSRRYPQFNKPELEASLEGVGIQYLHMKELGGRRQPRADSKNLAWKNAGFRGYADHMETEEFRKGIERLLSIAPEKRTAVMCAEAVWWRCHRSLIADFLKAGDVKVIHIIDATHTQEHPFTSAAQLVDGRLSYEGLLGGRQ